MRHLNLKMLRKKIIKDHIMNSKNFGFDTQIRKSPYFDATVRWGATRLSV